ncbi:MAG: 3-isopropylmalate dehydratase small subunit [Candidatus Bathyarchaeota archaeon]|nr:3-isopropylmalate dehydratase small subunit [Candidatus Bathyarchaeota archaeon]
MNLNVEGKAVKFGDNINTDVILPGKYLELIDPEELGKHALEGLDPTFAQRAREGVIIVGGKNFGCGSSREQAPIALKGAGVKCVLAESFARIFYRNAINIGLPTLECDGISEEVDEGDILMVDLRNGLIENKTKSDSLQTATLPPFILGLLEEGGLILHVRGLIGKR